VTPCDLVEIYRRFGRTCYLKFRPFSPKDSGQYTLPNNCQTQNRYISKDITSTRLGNVYRIVGSDPRGLAKKLEVLVCKQIPLLSSGIVTELESLEYLLAYEPVLKSFLFLS
jgi:hypothetical protein